MKKKIILASVLNIALCLVLITGSTFALFTSAITRTVSVTTAKVNVVATIDEKVETLSMGKKPLVPGTFVNGGSVTVDQHGNLNVTNMTPGDSVEIKISVNNYSSIDVLYRVRAVSGLSGTGKDLSDLLETTATIGGVDYVMKGSDKEAKTDWVKIEPGTTIEDITVTIEFPGDNDNASDSSYMGAGASITFVVEAVQGNAEIDSVTGELK